MHLHARPSPHPHPAPRSTAPLRYVLSKPPAQGWSFTSGHINEALMREKLFASSSTTLGLMCGPPGLLDNVAVPGFAAMGYAKEHTVSF